MAILNNRLHSCIRRLLSISLSVTLLFTIAMGQPRFAVSKEFQVKAAFLFNFAQFVDWPSKAFSDHSSPLIIGVLGVDPFGSFLDDTVKNERVNNRSLVVQRFRRAEDVRVCHILFIGSSEHSQLANIIAELKGRSILTVGDDEDFTKRGGMIRFVTEERKIRLRINLDATKLVHLEVSSKLLRPAKIVSTGGQ